MSKDLNKVQLTGRLGADVEHKTTPQGSDITKFRIATNGRKDGDVEWTTVIAWNKLAIVCRDFLHKGSRVYIEGRLQTRSWDDPTSGQKRYMTEVIADDMIMLDPKREAEVTHSGDPDVWYPEVLTPKGTAPGTVEQGFSPDPEPIPAPGEPRIELPRDRMPTASMTSRMTKAEGSRLPAPRQGDEQIKQDDMPF